MQNDLISREQSVKALRNYAEQKFAGGEVALANGILKAVNFLEKEENVPTAYSVETVVDGIHKYFCEVIEKCPEDNVPHEILEYNKAVCNIVRNGGIEPFSCDQVNGGKE